MRLRPVDRAVLGALLPSGASPLLPRGLLDTGFEGFLVEFYAAAPADFRRIFRLALVVAGWIAPLLIGRMPPMSRLNSDDRESSLVAMDKSRLPELRQLVLVLKTVASLHYGGLPEVRQAIGYHP